jgi:hypothetical protein
VALWSTCDSVNARTSSQAEVGAHAYQSRFAGGRIWIPASADPCLLVGGRIGSPRSHTGCRARRSRQSRVPDPPGGLAAGPRILTQDRVIELLAGPPPSGPWRSSEHLRSDAQGPAPQPLTRPSSEMASTARQRPAFIRRTDAARPSGRAGLGQAPPMNRNGRQGRGSPSGMRPAQPGPSAKTTSIARSTGLRRGADLHLRWSGWVWSPPAESNRRPHPYHFVVRATNGSRRQRIRLV